jgi:GMP synthase-like glutamine amidotransferase
VRIQVLQFDEQVGLGTFSGWLVELGGDITTWRCDQLQLPGDADLGAVILLGGNMGVGDRQQFPYLQLVADWVAEQVETGRPLLAICLGGQLLAYALGGSVASQFRQERGITDVELTAAGRLDPLFAGLPNPYCSFEWHNDSFELPLAALHLAQTTPCPGQAFRYKNAWGVQFHPEVDEAIIADWCRRSGAKEGLQLLFRQQQQRYFQQAKKLLENFYVTAQMLL